MSLFKSLFGPSKEEKDEQIKLEKEKKEKDFIQKIKDEKEKKEKDEQIKLEKEKEEKDEQIKLEKDEYLKLIKELDKDNNGLIDVVEGNDFSNILKKNQQEIININRDYIKQFVQVSNFLKTKRNSLQSMYENIVEVINTGGTYISLDSHLKQIDFNNFDKLDLCKKINETTKIGLKFSKEIVDSYQFGKPNPHETGDFKFYTSLNKNLIKKYFEILKDDIHIYNVLLISSLNMVESLIKNDMITFYEVYERFDELNMFDSKYERDIKHQLQNVNDNLGDVMNQIVNMGENIISSINDLSMITEESSKLITEGLQSVNSSINTNNLISTIQTYQLYRIGKNTKSLRE
tara:strand:+ start:1535 stop:2575 length:1041 start_codon:yes stop_codon:yes gene_type:complete